MGKLDGKTVVVTGAASGIGRACAELYAAEGGKVVVGDIDDDGGKETASRITGAGGEASYIHTDVSEEGQVEALLKGAVETYGSLDVLHNNAGIELYMPIPATDADMLNQVMDVNFKGAFWGCKYALPVMAQQGGGVIVNTASMAGVSSIPFQGVYSASKAAVISLTKSVAIEWAQAGIRCNCIAPAGVDTPLLAKAFGFEPTPAMMRVMGEMHPIGRLGTPDEIARGALWLACDDSSFTTGHTLFLDGGTGAGNIPKENVLEAE